MKTIIIDTGQDIVGIFEVATTNYSPYRGAEIVDAIRIVEGADEVVTYNGKERDFLDLQKFSLRFRQSGFSFAGRHVDMRTICWSDRIWGSSLDETYSMHFDSEPIFPDTYEGSNECDCYKTWKLWERWEEGTLKVLDGQQN